MPSVRPRTPDGEPGEFRETSWGCWYEEEPEDAPWTVISDWGEDCTATSEFDEAAAAARAKAESCLPGVARVQIDYRDRWCQIWVNGELTESRAAP